MAKTMFKGKWIKTAEQSGQEALAITMSQIDRENRKPRRVILGVRKIILDAYKTNGKNGAMLALRIFNRRANSSYTWNDAEGWINEENQKVGKEYGDD